MSISLSSARRIMVALVAVSIWLLWVAPAQAQDRITVEIGKAVNLPNTAAIASVFVADTSIADATVDEGSQVFVYGVGIGETTLFAAADDGRLTEYVVVVTHNLTELRRALSQRFPGTAVSISSSRGSVLVSGIVDSEQKRERLIQTIEASVPGSAIIDQMVVSTSNLITLRVRLLEVDRSRAASYGVNWDATVASNGFFLGTSANGVIRLGRDDSAVDSLNASLDVLTTSGIVSIQQESLLSTVTGQSAQFSVGGEIPVPTFVSDTQTDGGGNYKLDYKFIGTSLEFTPVNAPGEKLRLEIDSVISSAAATSTTVNGNTFPNLRSRAIKTSVELEDRQSFVIAGISRNEASVNLRNGRDMGFSRAVDTIFGADRTTNTDQELVIVVTPLLSDTDYRDPTQGLPRAMTNLEYILSGGRDGSPKATLGLPDAIRHAGFQY